MKTFLEIGASKHPELTCLLKSGWKDDNHKKRSLGQLDRTLPESYMDTFSDDPWQGVFVEGCPQEFLGLLETHKDIKNAVNILQLIGSQEFKGHWFYTQRYWETKEIFFTFPISLDDFLIKSGYRPKFIRIDIEGMEYEVIESYSFMYKPDFFLIEAHEMLVNVHKMDLDTEDPNAKLQQNFEDHGYKVSWVDEYKGEKKVIIAEKQ